MNVRTNRIFIILMLIHLVDYTSTAQRCEKLDNKLFAPCVNIGHTHSFALPDYVNKTRLSLVLKSYSQHERHCSESSLAMHCAFFLPMCKEGSTEPMLPCQRVCADFIKGCANASRPDHGVRLPSERYAGICTILRNESATSGNCFEPKDFTPSPSSALPKLGVCNKLVIPMCSDLGYNHTVLSTATQIRLFKAHMNTSVVPPLGNKTFLPRYMQWTVRRFPKCAVIMRKLFCTRFFPPCFPGEVKQYYAICSSECFKIYDLCPGFFNIHPNEYEFCTRASGGKFTHGFCAHTKWPKHWLLWPKREKPTANQLTVQPYVIAIAVVVPLVFLIVVVVSVFVWRRRRATQLSSGYNKHEDEIKRPN